MNDEDATRLLNQLAERRDVGPAPIGEIIDAGERTLRRRRRTTVLGVVAAVALVVLGGVLLPRTPGGGVRSAAGGVNAAVPAPTGSRLVGIGHAVIAVPQQWGTNKTRCGSPLENTVILNVGAVPACATTDRPANVSDVELRQSQGRPLYPDFSAARQVHIAGAPALKTPLRCSRVGLSHRPLCTQTLWLRSEGAVFTVSSPRAHEVRAILGTVRVDRRYAAVPFTNVGNTTPPSVEGFAGAAKALGLQVQHSFVHSRYVPAGVIIRSSPPSGTVLARGDTVKVIVSAGPGPRPTGSGTISSQPVSSCPLQTDVQRLAVTRTMLPGQRLSFAFPRLVTVQDPSAIARLATALCNAPVVPAGNVYNCPNDNGLTYHVTAFNGGTEEWAVDLHASGCTMVSGLGHGRQATADVWKALAAAMGVLPADGRSLFGALSGALR